MLELDHIALSCADLDAGAKEFARTTGWQLGSGGTHPLMATHNRLRFTGGKTYLELISPDPNAPPPATPRWFGLDDISEDAPPTLSFWMVKVDSLDDTVGALREIGFDPGNIIDMSRGSLNWRLTIRPDGTLPMGGAAPIFIEWPPGIHATDSMEDTGLRITNLTVSHPQIEDVQRICNLLGGAPSIVDLRRGPPSLSAILQDADGRVQTLSNA